MGRAGVPAGLRGGGVRAGSGAGSGGRGARGAGARRGGGHDARGRIVEPHERPVPRRGTLAHAGARSMKSAWRDGDRVRSVELSPHGGGRWRVNVDGVDLDVMIESLGRGVFRLTHAGGASVAEVTAVGARRFVRIDRRDYVVDREATGRRRSEGAASGGLESPMPGLVTKVMVSAGDDVRKGQALVAVEAMKMEHLIRSPRDGRVRRVAAVAGAVVG